MATQHQDLQRPRPFKVVTDCGLDMDIVNIQDPCQILVWQSHVL